MVDINDYFRYQDETKFISYGYFYFKVDIYDFTNDKDYFKVYDMNWSHF